MSGPSEEKPELESPGDDLHQSGEQDPEGGRLYWAVRHSFDAVKNLIGRHKVLFVLLSLTLVAGAVISRALWHPLLMVVRRHSYLPLALLLLVLLSWLMLRRRNKKAVIAYAVFMALAAAVVGACIYLQVNPHQYLAYYIRYQTLEKKELRELPITGHERVQPLNSLLTLARQSTDETEQVMRPNFVRVGEEYRFVLSVEPDKFFPRLVGDVRELINIPGSTPSPSFSQDSRETVRFETGENLFLGKNSLTNAVKTFGPWKFLNYEPADVRYVKDAKGQWVQLVSLIRWKGILFPRPEFGGVVLIRQPKDSEVLRKVRRLFLGEGEWVRPAEVAKHPFLSGQNTLTYEVSRYNAQSFRFQNGLLAPAPGYHVGDIRIPDLKEDINDQPFTAHFNIPGQKAKLYHYFALEPYVADKQGLNTSLAF